MGSDAAEPCDALRTAALSDRRHAIRAGGAGRGGGSAARPLPRRRPGTAGRARRWRAGSPTATSPRNGRACQAGAAPRSPATSIEVDAAAGRCRPSSSPQEIPLDVLFEDEHLIVINKPPGLVVHPAAGNPDGTLVNALLAHCRDLSGIGGVERPGIVHRLDKDTSGVLIAAKTDARPPRPLALVPLAHHRQALPGRRLRRAEDRRGRRRRADRPPPDRAQAHGGGRGRARRRARCGGSASASPAPRSSSAAWSPAAPTRSACTWPTSATPWSATRCTPAASGAASTTRRRPRRCRELPAPGAARLEAHHHPPGHRRADDVRGAAPARHRRPAGRVARRPSEVAGVGVDERHAPGSRAPAART